MSPEKQIDWKELKCEETSPLSRNTKIDCGAPAVALIWHQRDRRAYTMCEACAWHNLKNRRGILLQTISPGLEGM